MGHRAIHDLDAFGQSVWLDNIGRSIIRTGRLADDDAGTIVEGMRLFRKGGRPFNRETTRRIVAAWLRASFLGGRHLRRVRKISRLEKRFLGG
jgi:hypothetical protein